MATAETLVWYAQQNQRFISSVTADSALQAVLDDVPASELHGAAAGLPTSAGRACDGAGLLRCLA